MSYIRKEIAPEEIARQEEICRRLFDRLTADGRRPMAMVDTYGCQQNEADSEKLRGYLAEAKLIRAFSMFQLAQTFCMAWDPSKAEEYLGLPYPLEPEQDPNAKYERGTLEELYANIANDISDLVDIVKNGMIHEKALLALELVKNEYDSLLYDIKTKEDTLNSLRKKGVVK